MLIIDITQTCQFLIIPGYILEIMKNSGEYLKCLLIYIGQIRVLPQICKMIKYILHKNIFHVATNFRTHETHFSEMTRVGYWSQLNL